MRLYVIRHGETKENVSDCLGGRINSSLTERGIEQANKVKEYFKDKDIDLIVSSPKERCKETAEIISNNEISIIYDDKLLGRDHGSISGVSKNAMPYDDYWNIKKNITYNDAETVQALYDRTVSLIDDLKSKYKNKNVIIVTHSGIIRTMYYYFHGIPDDGRLSEVEIVNCGVYKYNL